MRVGERWLVRDSVFFVFFPVLKATTPVPCFVSLFCGYTFRAPPQKQRAGGRPEHPGRREQAREGLGKQHAQTAVKVSSRIVCLALLTCSIRGKLLLWPKLFIDSRLPMQQWAARCIHMYNALRGTECTAAWYMLRAPLNPCCCCEF